MRSTTESHDDAGERMGQRAGHVLSSIGAMAIAAIALLRATATFDAFPFWSLDPMQSAAPITGLTPSWMLTLDACVLLASGVVMLGEAVRRTRVRAGMVLLFVVGFVSIATHAWRLQGKSLDDLAIGATWASSVAGGVALFHAARHERIARMAAGACVGLVVLLAAKGAIQYFIEHQQTLEEFQKNREAFLASQGMTPDSVSARTFERRLSQPEATGWFGLSNVFASFCAGFATVCVAILMSRRGKALEDSGSRVRWVPAMLGVGAVAGVMGVALAGSKGGFVVLVFGVACAVVLAVARSIASVRAKKSEEDASNTSRESSRRLERIGSIGALVVIGLALLAIVVRGIVGERVGELSLLFRWFYMVGAVKIAIGHWLWGVGPAGFKEAYLLAKPARSPEEVTSPHSVLFDWWATLGIFGVAWAALWGRWVWGLGARIATGLLRPVHDAGSPERVEGESHDRARSEARMVSALVAIVLIASTWLERDTLAPEAAIVRVLGLLAWVGVSLAFLTWIRGRSRPNLWRGALALGVLMIALHSQIEVTSIWPNAAPLVMAMLGLAAAPAIERDERAKRQRPILAGGCALAFFAMAGALAIWGVWPVQRWERDLRDAAKLVEPLGEIRQRTLAVVSGGGRTPSGDTMASIATEVGSLLNQFPAQEQVGFDRALRTLTAQRAMQASVRLRQALALFPAHVSTREALVRIELARASALLGLGERAQAIEVASEAQRIAEAAPPNSAGLLLLANTLQTRADTEHDPRFLEQQLGVWERAAKLDPYGMNTPWRAFGTAMALGRTEDAKRWAAKVVQGEAYQRLDPLRRLTPEQRQSIDRVLNPDNQKPK